MAARKVEGKVIKRTSKPRPNQTAVTRATDWKVKFIARLRESGNVKVACAAARISRWTAYRNREADADFAQQWTDALEDAADVMEKEAWRRAVKGVEKPVFGRVFDEEVGTTTGIVGVERQYSDVLLIFLLKGARPDKFKDRVKQEISAEIHIDGFAEMLEKVYGDAKPGSNPG